MKNKKHIKMFFVSFLIVLVIIVITIWAVTVHSDLSFLEVLPASAFKNTKQSLYTISLILLATGALRGLFYVMSKEFKEQQEK